MFCHHCGSQIADDATACIHCGTFAAGPRAPAAPPPPNALPPNLPPPTTTPPTATGGATAGVKYCHHCGTTMAREAYVCVRCGVKAADALDPLERALFPAEGKSWVITLMLAIFGGALGLHRFYVGKVFTGLLLLVTFGGFGVFWIIDLIRILCGGFSDADGRPLAR